MTTLGYEHKRDQPEGPNGPGLVPGGFAAPEARIALLSASLLTLVAFGCGSLGLWRMGAEVWVGAAIAMQYTSWWLPRYANTPRLAAVKVRQL